MNNFFYWFFIEVKMVEFSVYVGFFVCSMLLFDGNMFYA